MNLSQAEILLIVRQKFVPEKTVAIQSYDIESLSDNIRGFLGDYFQLKVIVQLVEDQTTVELSFFIKSLPIANIQQRNLIEKYGIFHKEATLYSTLFPNLSDACLIPTKWRPECFLVRSDIIVLEDLHESGYHVMPIQQYFEEGHVKALLSCLARFHATSFNYEMNHDPPRSIKTDFGNILFETSYQFDNPWFVCGINAIKSLAMNNQKYGQDVIQRLPIVLNRIYSLVGSSDKYKNIICHRDLWHNNIMFKQFDDNSYHCILIDFQICYYSPLVFDVLNGIYFNTKPSHRKHILPFYLDFYYQQLDIQLTQYGLKISNILPIAEYYQAIDDFKIASLILNCIHTPLTHVPLETHIALDKDVDRFQYVSNVDRLGFILETMETCTFYKESVFEAIDELLAAVRNYEL